MGEFIFAAWAGGYNTPMVLGVMMFSIAGVSWLAQTFVVLLLADPSGGNGASAAQKAEVWSFHLQATVIPQGHGRFRSPYSGVRSLSAERDLATSVTSTLFAGRRLWKSGELYINPELVAGKGLSTTQGIAGFPNGEIFRVDTPSPKVSLARLFLRQTFGLGGTREAVEGDQNQLAGRQDAKRITVTIGKFALTDLFDDNAYSHDPRSQFMNWSLMDNGAWDFAANTRGYTLGAVVEYNRPGWALRFASVLEPKEANGPALDYRVAKARSDNLEFEYRYASGSRAGKVRLLTFSNHAHMGDYRATLDNQAFGLDITKTRGYRTKYGLGVNLEQGLGKDLGAFVRAGWNDGKTETWAFTEIDRTLAAGVSLKGSSWKRGQDNLGLALVNNGLSRDHADFLAAGGHGFIVGDGKLDYSREKIFEAYYRVKAFKGFSLSPDYQYVQNPGYNRDRGPVSVWALRTHYEF